MLDQKATAGVAADLQGYTSESRATGHELPHHSRHLTSYTRTGSSNPFATNSPRSANKNPLPEHNPRTVSATSISPPSAFAAIRDARITVAPKRSPSSSIGSPALSPTRMESGSP